MKKPKKITPQEAVRLVRKWRKIVGIEPQYKIMVAVCESPEQCPEAYREAEAFVSVQDGYFYAELVINAYNCKPEDLELAVVHEIVHIALWGIGEAAANAFGERNNNRAVSMVEQAVERLSRALVSLGGN